MTVPKRETKTFTAEVKALEGEPGTFEAIVSVFGNKDLGGDIVMPGAFSQTLLEWQAKGDPIPVIWSHEWDNPSAHIGEVLSATETEVGLLIRAKVDIDRPFAEQVHHLLKSRRVTQFSFGYFTEEAKWVEDENGRFYRELHRLSLFEVGPTLLGMNPETELLEAASATKIVAGGGRGGDEPATKDTDPDTSADTDGPLDAPTDDKSDAGDTPGTVNIERASALLVRPKYERNTHA